MPDRRSRVILDGIMGKRASRRTVLRRAAALGAGASALAAFGGGVRTVRAQDAKGPKVDKLLFWTRTNPDDPEYPSLKAMADAYTAAIGTPIEIATVADADFRNKLSLSAPAGEVPDVFGPIAHDWIGEIAIQGIALEVPDEVISNKADFVPGSLDGATVEGKLAALPLFVESVALIYNKDMVPTPPATWEELVTIATELTSGDVYGFGFPLLEQYHEGAFFQGFGSYIFKYENGQFDTEDIGLNKPEGVAAAKFLRDMYNQQQPPLPEVAIDRTNMHGVQEGMMEEGQLAMTINGPWREPPLQAAGINYGVAKLPTLPNGQPMRPFLGFQFMLASAFSENQEAALDFVNFIASTNQVVELSKGWKKVPVRQSALDNEALKADPNVAVWVEQAADGIPMPNIPAMGQVWVPWGAAMDAIIPPNAPDDEIQGLLDNAVEQIQAAIAESEE